MKGKRKISEALTESVFFPYIWYRNSTIILMLHALVNALTKEIRIWWSEAIIYIIWVVWTNNVNIFSVFFFRFPEIPNDMIQTS